MMIGQGLTPVHVCNTHKSAPLPEMIISCEHRGSPPAHDTKNGGRGLRFVFSFFVFIFSHPMYVLSSPFLSLSLLVLRGSIVNRTKYY